MAAAGHRFTDAVREVLSRHDVSRGVCAAVSGGPDSVALFVALRELSVPKLTIVHVNHRLRGLASEEDEHFVRVVADNAGADVRCVVAAVPGDRNIEATARNLRYRALVEVAHEIGAAVIVTGHTADDQAETVMQRLMRGTGICGLAGILPTSRRDGVLVLRPLLRVRRGDVVDFLRARNQAFRVDASNADPRFTRNRIRAELMPIVESFNPRVVAHLCRVADLARRQGRVETHRAKRALVRCELPRADDLCILDREKLSPLSPELARLMWRLVWRREGWPRDAMGFREWERLARLCHETQAAIDLPGGIRARLLPRIVRVGPGA